MLVVRLIAVLFFVHGFTGCGSFSTLRPADNLEAGKTDLTGGIAISASGTLGVVGQINHGVINDFEVGAQYESSNYYGWVKWEIFGSEEAPIAVAISAGGGYVGIFDQSVFDSLESSSFFDLDFDPIRSGAVLGGVTLGKRINNHEIYLGYRIFFMPKYSYAINAIKVGDRIFGSEVLFVILEVGTSIHHSFGAMAEMTAGLGFQL